jgi:hypothetical protein
MLDESDQEFILDVMDQQLSAVATGGVEAERLSGFASSKSSSRPLEGIDWGSICAAHGFSFAEFQETRRADKGFDEQCRYREDQLAEQVKGKAIKSAFASDKPREIVAVAERINKDFAPAAKEGGGNTLNFELFLGGKDGDAIRGVLEHFEEVDRRRELGDEEARRAIAMIEASAEVVR